VAGSPFGFFGSCGFCLPRCFRGFLAFVVPPGTFSFLAAPSFYFRNGHSISPFFSFEFFALPSLPRGFRRGANRGVDHSQMSLLKFRLGWRDLANRQRENGILRA
jgi:hypothetical protein